MSSRTKAGLIIVWCQLLDQVCHLCVVELWPESGKRANCIGFSVGNLTFACEKVQTWQKKGAMFDVVSIITADCNQGMDFR